MYESPEIGKMNASPEAREGSGWFVSHTAVASEAVAVIFVAGVFFQVLIQFDTTMVVSVDEEATE